MTEWDSHVEERNIMRKWEVIQETELIDYIHVGQGQN